MKFLYLCLFLLQIYSSLSSLSTFNKVDTNIKEIRLSNKFITCLRKSTIPIKFLKHIKSMNTFPMTNIDNSLLSHSFTRKEILNLRYIINNCSDYLPMNINTNNNTKKHTEPKPDEPKLVRPGKAYRHFFSSSCSPSNLTECFIPYIELESEKNDLLISLESEGWEDNIQYVLSKYNKKEMKACVNASECYQFNP